MSIRNDEFLHRKQADGGGNVNGANPLPAKVLELEARIGDLTDAIVAAGATGSVSAKLRRLTTDLDETIQRLGATADAVVDAGAAGSLAAKVRRLTADLDVAKAKLGDLVNWVDGTDTTSAPNVTLSGTIVEEATLVDALAITDTSSRVTSTFSTKTFKTFDILVLSTLNEDLSIQFQINGSGIRLTKADGTIAAQTTTANQYTIPADSLATYLSLYAPTADMYDSEQFRRYKVDNMRFAYRCAVAPTSGAVSIIVQGVYS